MDDTVLWLPHLSSLGTEVDSSGKVAVNITAAVNALPIKHTFAKLILTVFLRSSSGIQVLTSWAADSVEAIFSIPTPQLGTLSPRIETSHLLLELIGIAGEYSVYSGLTQLDASTANRTTTDFVAKGGQGTAVNQFRKLADIL